MSAHIEIFFIDRVKPIQLTLPGEWGHQWLTEVCETLENAQEILHIQFTLKKELP